MIAKKYRLSEKELRRVFREKTPFFSSLMTANVKKNNCSHARIGILLSRKHTAWSVNRNAFRRIFYKNSHAILEYSYDIVFIVKKWIQFSHKNPADIENFQKNIEILYQKIISQ